VVVSSGQVSEAQLMRMFTAVTALMLVVVT